MYSHVLTRAVVACVAFLGPLTALSHDPQEDRDPASNDYEQRVARVQYMHHHAPSPAIAQRAHLKTARLIAEANSISVAEMSARLFRGPQPLFPYTTRPELRAEGDPSTLTVPVDFEDYRAASTLPLLTRESIHRSIYGEGSTNCQHEFPYESVRSYYSRASEGKLNIRGEVLDWHHFPNKRRDYEPKTAAPGTDREDRQAYLDNQALFRIVVAALKANDSNHDYRRYDNDNDGDIDVVTILYAGPRGKWGSFWWAYQWEFFLPEASQVRFDGKRLRQFVFQFVETRCGGAEFDPHTLLHETGHALGLADYYDYDPKTGPQGGVGGLDMMDGNWGNHCAYSRWLLDWITPAIATNGPPSVRELVASGATNTPGTKAVAIFPRMTAPDAPAQEFYLVENRSQFGNDAGKADMPGQGLLIWHIDSTVKEDGSGFNFDNSYTPRKLIRLVRADSETDFCSNCTASGSTYFADGAWFGDDSKPNSKAYDGTTTGILITNISTSGASMSFYLHFQEVIPDRILIAHGSPTKALAELGIDQPQLTQAPRSVSATDIDSLLKFQRELEVLSGEQLAELWRNESSLVPRPDNIEAQVFRNGIIANSWASKDGRAALDVIANTESARGPVLLSALQSWAEVEPADAGRWYLDEQHSKLRSELNQFIGGHFAQRVFSALAMENPEFALASIEILTTANAQFGAVVGARKGCAARGLNESSLDQRFARMQRAHSPLNAVVQLESVFRAMEAITNDVERASMIRLLKESSSLLRAAE
jgi:M6 family metalloprotease-like protein